MVMADFTKNIWFEFSAPPGRNVSVPKVKVDASSSPLVLQAVLLRILDTISIESVDGAAEIMFPQGSE